MRNLFDEKSAGIILTTNALDVHSRKILFLLHSAGHWDFPKGNIEAGETETQAASKRIEGGNRDILLQIPPTVQIYDHIFL